MKFASFCLISLSALLVSCRQPVPPAPYGPLPSERQLAWHQLEYYAFVHFNMNTFTNREWGLGNEKPEQFNPAALDCRQWVRICKAAGIKGIILTAKHHDGFCLWPSAYTGHSVKNSPWKGGKGDVVGELSEACREYGLRMGIYLSPWDRNRADYGKPEYITYYRNQLKELLTNYGDIFEVWFDGANGGTGWYGGANEDRRIDRTTYYDWPNTIKIVRELQPSAVMFSDGGPDIRWVGNEQGWARPTNWSLLKKKDFGPGVVDSIEHLRSGQEDGTDWLPAEVDVSIRPGWFYHPAEDTLVKPLTKLLDIYYSSVGRNAGMLLNIPPDSRGLIHPADSARLMELAAALKSDFETDIAFGRKIKASNIRGKARQFGPSMVNDHDLQTYWATDDSIRQASLTLTWNKPVTFNRFLVGEYIPLGQRVRKFRIEAQVDGTWKTVAAETTIGNKRILRFPDVTSARLRFIIEDSKACPVISDLRVYKAEEVYNRQDRLFKYKTGNK